MLQDLWLFNLWIFSRHVHWRFGMSFGLHLSKPTLHTRTRLYFYWQFFEHSNMYLPSSFLGSHRWASEQIADGLALAACFGTPTFFVTFTCNPHWPEITSQLRPGQQCHDVPLIVCRVFKQKFTHFLKSLSSMFLNAGDWQYIIFSTEFQKRGLPHCHILIKFNTDCQCTDNIDNIVSAEVPVNEADAALVQKYMLHKHPCPHEPLYCYCQRENAGTRHCRFHYLQPLQLKMTVDKSGKVHYRCCNSGNEMVVPYCLPLLCIYQCHINFEVASTAQLFQYIFKYIHKGDCLLLLLFPLSLSFLGPDGAKVQIRDTNAPVDEIDDFWQAICWWSSMAHSRFLLNHKGTCHICSSSGHTTFHPPHSVFASQLCLQYNVQDRSLFLQTTRCLLWRLPHSNVFWRLNLCWILSTLLTSKTGIAQTWLSNALLRTF